MSDRLQLPLELCWLHGVCESPRTRTGPIYKTMKNLSRDSGFSAGTTKLSSTPMFMEMALEKWSYIFFNFILLRPHCAPRNTSNRRVRKRGENDVEEYSTWRGWSLEERSSDSIPPSVLNYFVLLQINYERT